jgi:hypothetical protein
MKLRAKRSKLQAKSLRFSTTPIFFILRRQQLYNKAACKTQDLPFSAVYKQFVDRDQTVAILKFQYHFF